MTAWPEPLTDAWFWVEERAGILEYQGGEYRDGEYQGMTREDAEKQALEEWTEEEYKRVFGEEASE